jgi:hypothetical protein
VVAYDEVTRDELGADIIKAINSVGNTTEMMLISQFVKLPLL